MRIVSYTRSARRDYRRVKSDRYGKILDVALMEIVDLLAADTRLAAGLSIMP